TPRETTFPYTTLFRSKGEQTPAKGGIAPTVASFEEDRGYFEDADYDTARDYLAQGMEELGYDDTAAMPIVIQTNDNDSHMAVARSEEHTSELQSRFDL